MNNKIIAAGVVVALCAVALIGVGYAYTATVTTAGNEFGSDYIIVKSGTGTEAVWSQTKDSAFSFDTVTNASSVTYTSIEGTTSGTVVILRNGLDNSSVKLEMIIDLDDLTGDYDSLFYNSADSAYATVSFNGGSAIGSYVNDGNLVKWSADVTLSDDPTDVIVLIQPILGVAITGTVSEGPLIENLPIKFVATYPSS